VRSKNLLILLVVLGVGGWLFLNRFTIEGWQQLRIRERSDPQTTPSAADLAPPSRRGESVLVGVWQARRGGPDALDAEAIAEVLPRFDLLVLVGMPQGSDAPLEQALAQVNADELRYARAKVAGRNGFTHCAVLFDQGSLEVDPAAAYFVSDPGRLFAAEPLAAALRVRGPDPRQAFTFTVVAITDPGRGGLADAAGLRSLWRAVRSDGRGEDDVLLAGCVGVATPDASEGNPSLLTWAVPPSAADGAAPMNLVFDSRATVEFAGEAGWYDPGPSGESSGTQSAQNATPIAWATFSLREGPSGPLAGQPRVKR
jgi:hypothetical protein